MTEQLKQHQGFISGRQPLLSVAAHVQLLPSLYAFKSQSAHLKERRREVFIKGLMSSKPSEEAPQALSQEKKNTLLPGQMKKSKQILTFQNWAGEKVSLLAGP